MDFEHGFVVTGSIGCGKSSFCSILSQQGFEIIDADTIAHEELQNMADDIANEFGSIIVKDGIVNRKLLGDVVFADKQAKLKLEALLHPKVKTAILAKSNELEMRGRPYFVDIPLYFETANYTAKNVIVVYAPLATQLERLTKQKGMSVDEANARISSQIDIERKRQMANIVIDNSEDMGHLQVQTNEFLKGLTK